MAEIPKEYVENAVDEIFRIIGIRENIEHRTLVSLVRSQKIEECIEKIAQQLALPIKVKLEYVPDGYRPNATDGFSSSNIVMTGKDGRGHQGIVAQVSIPRNLPIYGSSSLVNLPIRIRLSKNCAQHPETLICVMAHELSHIVLYSIGHEQKENEIYTDLTAMILGFADVTRLGRKTVNKTYSGNAINTQTTTYGYLSDINFSIAHEKIAHVLSTQRALESDLKKNLTNFREQIQKANTLAERFREYLRYVDNHSSQRFAERDLPSLSAFHHPGFLDTFSHRVAAAKKTESHIAGRLATISRYTVTAIELIQQSRQQLRKSEEDLRKHADLLNRDLKTLGRYVGFWYRLKLGFRM